MTACGKKNTRKAATQTIKILMKITPTTMTSRESTPRMTYGRSPCTSMRAITDLKPREADDDEVINFKILNQLNQLN